MLPCFERPTATGSALRSRIEPASRPFEACPYGCSSPSRNKQKRQRKGVERTFVSTLIPKPVQLVRWVYRSKVSEFLKESSHEHRDTCRATLFDQTASPAACLACKSVHHRTFSPVSQRKHAVCALG